MQTHSEENYFRSGLIIYIINYNLRVQEAVTRLTQRPIPEHQLHRSYRCGSGDQDTVL